jgi:hypothetical protein
VVVVDMKTDRERDGGSTSETGTVGQSKRHGSLFAAGACRPAGRASNKARARQLSAAGDDQHAALRTVLLSLYIEREKGRLK